MVIHNCMQVDNNLHITVINFQVLDKRIVVETCPVIQQADRACVDVLLFAILALENQDAGCRFHPEGDPLIRLCVCGKHASNKHVRMLWSMSFSSQCIYTCWRFLMVIHDCITCNKKQKHTSCLLHMYCDVG